MRLIAAVIMLASLAMPATARAHEELGTVHFPVSCTPAAQRQFDRALAMLHSFFFPETLEAFAAVTKTDPACAMGYWGIAMSTRPNPLIPLDVATLTRGWEAIEKAKSSYPPTQRERDYIGAMETYYRDPGKGPSAARATAYAEAMKRVYLRYPGDREAAIFYALALNEAVDHTDRTYARQLAAGAILEKAWKQQPDHPGIPHYIIHSYDFPTLARRGIQAARAYAKIAPAAPHALHMPSHIFSMVGSWHELIPADRAAAAFYRAYSAKNFDGAVTVGQLHSMDFLEYAYLQGAQDAKAKAILDERNRIQKFFTRFLHGDTAFAAIPVRHALERGRWTEAAALDAPATAYPAAEAISVFGKGLGAARGGDVAGARRAIEKLQALHDTLARGNDTYWAEQVKIQRLTVWAWVARAEHRTQEAIETMRSAADLEDKSAKHIALENRLVPMRELLGELLLELNQPGRAFAEFERSLQAAPNRFRSLYGAARAAARGGAAPQARAYYKKLVAVAAHADTERPELIEARAFLARKR